MIVAVDGLSGDTNAYRSVLSAVGSCEISGASRWLDALAATVLPRCATAKPSAVSAATTTSARKLLFTATPSVEGRRNSPDRADRFGRSSYVSAVSTGCVVGVRTPPAGSTVAATTAPLGTRPRRGTPT